ncbi:uncharacterized protein [Littorina saxatilis]|uniref:uncharacterized protein n=1 Tax=Littorina saxatilis TaxID=31220 RepID=UPI0038B49272
MSSSSCDHPATFTAQLAPGNYHAVCSYRLTNGPVAGTFPVDSATPAAFFTAYTDKVGVADDLKVAAAMEVQVSRKGPLLLRSLPLLKLPGFNLEALMTTLRTGQNYTATNSQSAAGDVDTPDKALHICAWDMVATQQTHKKTTQANNLLVESMMEMSGSSSSQPPTTTNPRLSTGNLEYVLLPPLSVFNMGVSLYFANSWSYYDKHYVTLVLCKKGSPCQQVCKRNFHKLDPYNNPFLFRKRYFDPEPGVAVYASGNVNVEVVYSNSDTIQQLISSCSENVYFSKVQVGGV